jgi:hypothetical protein
MPLKWADVQIGFQNPNAEADFGLNCNPAITKMGLVMPFTIRRDLIMVYCSREQFRNERVKSQNENCWFRRDKNTKGGIFAHRADNRPFHAYTR